jgi:trehalose 6-phosphate phosphatase
LAGAARLWTEGDEGMKRRSKSPKTYRRGESPTVWRRMPRTRSRRGSCHLFDRWAEVSRRLRRAEHLMLFLDFDGTLVPLRHRPGDVWLDPAVRRIVERLARQQRVSVCLISGRRLADLRQRTRISGVSYVGLHGWERGGRARRAAPEFLTQLKRSLALRLGALPGIRIEDKRFSIGVHYRGARGEIVRRARLLLRECLKPFHQQFRLLKGKKVWEILPAEVAGKGAAAREVLAELDRPALPVYLGDDTTDEAAFEALRAGITVRVGPTRQTRARYRLRKPKEVWDFLERFEEEIQ